MTASRTRRALRAVATIFLLLAASTVAAQPNSVYIEDLTWPELQARIARGAVVAILPTGGTEQNGPHMALGKHNFVVRETAGRIARSLGTALVAPLIPIVPEGPSELAAGNSSFPGTLGLSEESFARVLRDAAAGLARSGFKLICLIGDHGQSQGVQAAVAAELSRAWTARGVRVVHVAAYYRPEAQDAELERAGIPRETLGDHAGVADTAQLMAVNPGAVRSALAVPESWKTPGPSGASGRPERATPAIGERLLRQRVAAAVAEIRASER